MVRRSKHRTAAMAPPPAWVISRVVRARTQRRHGSTRQEDSSRASELATLRAQLPQSRTHSCCDGRIPMRKPIRGQGTSWNGEQSPTIVLHTHCASPALLDCQASPCVSPLRPPLPSPWRWHGALARWHRRSPHPPRRRRLRSESWIPTMPSTLSNGEKTTVRAIVAPILLPISPLACSTIAALS